MYEFARLEFEKYYNCLVTISAWKNVKVGNITKGDWVEVETDVPCRISQKRQVAPVAEGVSGSVVKVTELYCSPDIEIPPGSRLTVTDVHGNTAIYKLSSEPIAHHNTHQAITIVLSEVA